jgi:hypothetical protein
MLVFHIAVGAGSTIVLRAAPRRVRPAQSTSEASTSVLNTRR